MAADTSSSAAARIPVVGAAAATLASLSVEPIFARSVAAAVTSSGAAITNDMGHLPPRHDAPESPGQHRVTRRFESYRGRGNRYRVLLQDHLVYRPAKSQDPLSTK